MYRIRRIRDVALPRNLEAVRQVQEIFRKQFSYVLPQEADAIPEKISNPFKEQFVSFLLIAEGAKKNVRGFALVSYEPQLRFAFLDYIAVASGGTGIGSVLYEAVREECLATGCDGLFFECLPDDPSLMVDTSMLKQNVERLKLYERYRARPIINTLYEAPTSQEADNAAYLMYDDLDQGLALLRDRARVVVRTILERKYKGHRTQEYINQVVDSIQDDPVQIRPPRYTSSPATSLLKASVAPSQKIVLCVSSTHAMHRVRMRVHAESPVRVSKVLEEISKSDLFRQVDAWSFPEKHIRAVHDGDFVLYLKKMAERLGENETVYPYVFPLRNRHRFPHDVSDQVGYYCVDTITPLSRNAIAAARGAVDCALTAAEALLEGNLISYALVRPPGHHAERDNFGGYCYYNNAAIAAQYLSALGRIAILDVDYHHGNGQQDIFYRRSDVLTVSIHCHPRFTYPYFAGFEDEPGEGDGKGFNLNITLPEQEVDGEKYRVALVRALKRVNAFKPRFLVLAFGADTAKGDPTGSWLLTAKDFELNGRLIGQLRVPTLVVQEGGYRIGQLGKNVLAFLRGLWTTMHAPADDTLPSPRNTASPPSESSSPSAVSPLEK